VKAIIAAQYGPPERLELREVEKPSIDADGVLVRVRAASVNPLDWHLMRGDPYFVRLMFGLRRPKKTRVGVDMAGVVEEVGANVTQLRPGDEVFGGREGAFGEYVSGWEHDFAPKPAGLSFEQAAAIPVAGCTALQALRDKGQLKAGQNVLVNGAAGGVGTFAVQIAKALGAQVTAVCSTRNLEMVRSIGADHVVDYSAEDFTQSGQHYDLLLDAVGNRSFSDLRRVMTPGGALVVIGGEGGGLLGPMASLLKLRALALFARSQRLISFLAKVNRGDLLVLKELVEAGKVTPVVERTYPLTETAAAIAYLETKHARGKVAITV
jgi:NADPH:quinone reductase-like Zn-dependent oxidoreductase